VRGFVILSEVEGSDEMSKAHDYWVYMMSNKTRRTLYVGVTNNLLVRVAQHRRGEIPGFTKDYHCVVLVYHSHFREMRDAIAWEKQLKGMAAFEEKRAYRARQPTLERLGHRLVLKWLKRNNSGPSTPLRFAQDDTMRYARNWTASA
jgi:putative endonuclease